MAENKGHDNIKGQGFHTNPERIGGGRPKGLKNRSTILEELLALASKYPDKYPNTEYQMNRAIIRKACKGDVAAFKEIQDTMYGKVPDKIETKQEVAVKDVTAEALKHLPQEVLESLMIGIENDKSE